MVKIKHLSLVFILLLGLLLRFYLATQSFHVDLLIQAGWGEYVGSIGAINLYEHTEWIFSWPNHPPLINLFYGLSYQIYIKLFYFLPRTALYLHNHPLLPPTLVDQYTSFASSFTTDLSPSQPFPFGFLLCLKLWPILADLLLCLVIYFFAQKFSRHGFFFAILYLFSPFVFYLSSAWGQTDQLGFLPVLLSALSLNSVPILSLPLLWLGISLKPTALLLLPSFGLLYSKYKIPQKYVFIGVLFCFIFTYLYTHPFTNQPVWPYLIHEIIPKVFNRGEGRLTTNSYNFWHIATLGQPVSDSIVYFLLPSKYFSYFFVIFIHLFAWLKTRHSKNIFSILTFLFITSGGIWIFSSNMLDRYFFPALIFGLFISIRKPKLLFFWSPLSLIFLLNLTRGYWYPGPLIHIKDLFEKQPQLEVIPAILNTVLYTIIATLA